MFALSVCLLAVPIASMAQSPRNHLNVTVKYEDPIANANYPELVYWFVTPETLAPQRYSRDIQHIAHDTVFDFPFLTARNGVNFFDNKAAHDAVAGIVRESHQNGLRVGATLEIQDIDSMRTFPPEEEQTVVGEGEGDLDASGHGVVESTVKLRATRPTKTELLRVFAFRKTGAGEYDPATLTDVTARANSTVASPGTISVSLDLGPRYAGYTAYVMATTWFHALDLFNDAYTAWVHEAINQYRDVPFDGTALDEFGYMHVPMIPITPLRGHFAGSAFGARF